MDQLQELVAAIAAAIKDGRTVKITADEIKIESEDVTINALDLTVE